MKSIQDRVRAAQAARTKPSKLAEYQEGAAERRSQAARFAAPDPQGQRVDALIDGRAGAVHLAEAEISDGELAERDDFEALQDYVG
jgi:hypothetical protein